MGFINIFIYVKVSIVCLLLYINILNYLDEEGINNIKQDDEYKNYV